MALQLIVAPAVEPVSIDDVKLHTRIDHNVEDDWLDRAITSARQDVEARVSRQLVEATWDLQLPCFPGGDVIRPPLAPLLSVESITYYDTAGALQTWAATEYLVSAPSGFDAPGGHVELAPDKSYPQTQRRFNAVTVRFKAGYGAEATDVPAGLRDAILVTVAERYKHREETVGVGSVQTVPMTVKRLLAPFRWRF